MEEDIKILEELLNANVSFKISPEDRGYKAIENLIKGYKELEEENEICKEELEKIDKVLNLEAGRAAPYRYEIIESLQRGITQLKKIIDNSIPVSLVEEKIEELKQYKISLLQEDYVKKQKEFTSQNVLVCNAIRDIAATGKIEVLQELLEKRK